MQTCGETAVPGTGYLREGNFKTRRAGDMHEWAQRVSHPSFRPISEFFFFCSHGKADTQEGKQDVNEETCSEGGVSAVAPDDVSRSGQEVVAGDVREKRSRGKKNRRGSRKSTRGRGRGMGLEKKKKKHTHRKKKTLPRLSNSPKKTRPHTQQKKTPPSKKNGGRS